MNNSLRSSESQRGPNLKQPIAQSKTPLGFLSNYMPSDEDIYPLAHSNLAALKLRPNSINSNYNSNGSKSQNYPGMGSGKQMPKKSQITASTPQKKNSLFSKNNQHKNKILKNGHKSTAKLAKNENREVYSQLNILGDPNKNINTVSKLASAKSHINLLINLETEHAPAPPKQPSTVVTTTNGNTKSFYKEGGSNQSSVKNLNQSSAPTKKVNQAKNLAINISKISQFQPSENSTKSVRASIGKNTAGASQSQGSSSKRQYLYCIDTKQIINMIEYSIQMLQVPIKEIQDFAKKKSKFDKRSKSSSDSSGQEKISVARLKSQNKEQSKPLEKETSEEVFCAGNQDLNNLVIYINNKLIENEQKFQFKQNEKKQSELFKGNTSPSQKFFDKSKMIQNLNFSKIFSLDDTKFTYFVENEKILSGQMFFVDSQRENFIRCLKEIKNLLKTFIQRKYKDCITKIGFSSEKELYNIFNKMLSAQKNFFGKINVRKVLSQFWLSIKDVFKQKAGKTQLSYFDEVLLKNNYYLRLEIVSRGRFIFEPDTFPLHQAIFQSNLRNLSKLLKLEVEGVFYTEKNQLDCCGNTPLMLAVKMGNIDAVKILSDMYTCPKLRPLQELMNAKEIAIAMKNPQILKILISSNQKIKQQFFEKNKEAIFKVLEKMPDFQVDLNLTCDSNWFPVFSSVAPSDTYKIYKQGSNLRLDMTLLGLQKFNLIKGNITMLYKGRNSGENEGDLLVIDNKFQTVNNIFNRNQEQKINQQIQEILSGKQILKKFQTHSAVTEVESDRYGRAIVKKINGYESEKYVLKSRYTMIKYQMNLNQIDQIKGIKDFEDYKQQLKIDYISLIEMHLDNISYERDEQKRPPQGAPLTSRVNLGGTTKMDAPGGGFSSRESSQFRNLAEFNSGPQQMYTQEDQSNEQILPQKCVQQNKQITVKKKQQKQVIANLWLSKTYPFNIDQFMPLIHVLSFCSKQIRQFNKFLLKYQLPFSHECFPIEARIPLFMTMEAVFSFKNIQMKFNDSKVFQIDKEVSVKQQENMAIYAKQQISYLNMHSSLDTQEDKQAKALKEIYKLCKTDEGDQSADYMQGHENLYRVIEESNPKPRPPDGYESENSDKIKELFNKMLTKEDEQGENDLLVIEENYYQEDLLGHGLTPSAIKYDQPQSRNFAKGSFHDIKASLSHSDLLRLRKSGHMNGRTPSKQFSLQSDITESIEVSERSFNDKLTKLQIHSFQNVKFMSQFKKNSKNSKNLEQILAEQFPADQPSEKEVLNKQKNNLEEFKKRAKKINNIQFQGGLHGKNDKILAAKAQFLANHPEALQNHMKHVSNVSGLSFHSYMSSFNHGENIYDSKINEERPKINKSLGKHQINNNLHMWTKMGAKIYKEEQPHIDEQAWDIKKDMSVMTIQKDFEPKTIPRQKNHINFMGQPAPSFGVSNIESMSGSSAMQSMSSLIPEAQKPNSTADSSLRVLPGSSISNRDNTQLLDKNKLKLILGNLRNDNNQPRPRYLNTIESEGNLPTQQIGKTSLRSICSLPSEGSEEKKNSSYHRQMHQQEARPMHTGDNGSQGSDDLQQIFSYEKQHRTNDFADLSRNTNVRRQDSSSQQPPQNKQLCPKEQLKLNFFQKVSNFIQESITERKHQPDPDEEPKSREPSKPKKLYHRKFENNSAGRKFRDCQEEGGSFERTRNNYQLQTKFTCTDGERIESENKRASLLALETHSFLKNHKK